MMDGVLVACGLHDNYRLCVLYDAGLVSFLTVF